MFKDINPKAPTHLLVIPKKREGLTQLRKAQPDHASLLGHMLTCIAKVLPCLRLPCSVPDAPGDGFSV
jgi:diadenosine tetraphosphate (Ap4A) HIT family hydrolase